MNNNRLLRRLGILSWPIWLKLAVGFLIAIVVPVVLVLSIVNGGLRDMGLRTVEASITENGSQQLLNLRTALDQARSTLTQFVTNAVYDRALTGTILRQPLSETELSGAANNPTQTATLFSTVLLNGANTIYEQIRLLDANGQLVVQSSLGTTPAGTTVTDQSRSGIYQAMQNAQLRSEDQAMAVLPGDSPAVEIASAIRWRNNTVIGFLVARLNISRTIYDNLAFKDSTFNAYSYLISQNHAVLTPPESRAQAAASSDSRTAQTALNGETAVDVYTLPNGQEVIGYYAPVPNSQFALITEVPSDAALPVVLRNVSVQGFVLVVGAAALIGFLMVGLFNLIIVPPLNHLRETAEAVSGGNFSTPIPDVERGDEIGSLATAFSNMRDQVQNLIRDLEARVAARTHDIEATQEIGRFAATQRDLQTLMDRVVSLIVERFPNIYHAQIFLLDPERIYAVLRASTGDAGKALLARGHRLAVGSVSVIGQVTQRAQVVVARDTSVSQVHRRNEFLQETRAELAIPLRVGDTVIGALDVQSKQRDAFNQDQVNVLQIMADQLAVAIENARLYQESVRRLAEIEESNRQATLRAWQDYMRDQRVRELESEAGVKTNLNTVDLRQTAVSQGKIVVGDATERNTVPIAVPIQLRGQTLGAVQWELPVKDLDDNKLQLAQDLANRLAVSLENARLFQDSQRTAERERLVNSIASKLTAQTDIEEILQTAVREVGQALRAPEVSIRLHRVQVESSNGPSNGNGHSAENGHSTENGHVADNGHVTDSGHSGDQPLS
jgi:GAF domain-containing protein/HAMP domain-containing protein